MLSLLLQARYENGEPISDQYIADELLTMLVAGHETTSAQLAWAIERLRRHPRLLQRLTDEVDAGGSELRQATIFEVQRTRPVLTAALRRAKKRIRLGEWVIPENNTVMASIQLAQASEQSFPNSESFNPDRFVGAPPNPFAWIPFGGGMMRCIGASFATMEMDVALRTILREFRFEPTDAPGERRHSRGVAIARTGRSRRWSTVERSARRVMLTLFRWPTAAPVDVGRVARTDNAESEPCAQWPGRARPCGCRAAARAGTRPRRAHA